MLGVLIPDDWRFPLKVLDLAGRLHHDVLRGESLVRLREKPDECQVVLPPRIDLDGVGATPDLAATGGPNTPPGRLEFPGDPVDEHGIDDVEVPRPNPEAQDVVHPDHRAAGNHRRGTPGVGGNIDQGPVGGYRGAEGFQIGRLRPPLKPEDLYPDPTAGGGWQIHPFHQHSAAELRVDGPGVNLDRAFKAAVLERDTVRLPVDDATVGTAQFPPVGGFVSRLGAGRFEPLEMTDETECLLAGNDRIAHSVECGRRGRSRGGRDRRRLRRRSRSCGLRLGSPRKSRDDTSDRPRLTTLLPRARTRQP